MLPIHTSTGPQSVNTCMLHADTHTHALRIPADATPANRCVPVHKPTTATPSPPPHPHPHPHTHPHPLPHPHPPLLEPALGEVARCLRPGGIAAFATWGPLKDNSWLGVIYDALEFALQKVPLPPTPPPEAARARSCVSLGVSVGTSACGGSTSHDLRAPRIRLPHPPSPCHRRVLPTCTHPVACSPLRPLPFVIPTLAPAPGPGGGRVGGRQ